MGNKALLLACETRDNPKRQFLFFQKQIADLKLASMLGAQTPETTDVKYFGNSTKKSLLLEHDLLVNSNGTYVKLSKSKKLIKLREPMFGFEQQWLEGLRISLDCALTYIKDILRVGMSDWNHFRPAVIKEFILLRTFVEKLSTLDRAMDDSQVIIATTPLLKIFLIDVDIKVKQNRTADIYAINCLITFLDYKNSSNTAKDFLKDKKHLVDQKNILVTENVFQKKDTDSPECEQKIRIINLRSFALYSTAFILYLLVSKFTNRRWSLRNQRRKD